MSSETGERRPTSLNPTGPRPQEPENLPCPRCDSTNTKFCYYNNYNLSQPRHFCKSCRRYWTRGGTLRNVPVGGGTRKASTKRSRVSTRSTTPTTTTAVLSPSSSTVTHVVSNPISIIPGIKPETGLEISLFGHTDLNQTEPQSVGPFTSLLNTHGGGVGLPFCGYGLGLASGYHTMGYGLSMTDWPMEEVGEVNNVGGIGVSSEDGDSAAATMAMTTSSSNTWHIGGGEGGLADGDFFAWPNLAISSPSKRFK